MPLLYAFMKEKHPSLKRVLEETRPGCPAKKFDEIVSSDIIREAMATKDPLCTRVVEKFVDIFGS